MDNNQMFQPSTGGQPLQTPLPTAPTPVASPPPAKKSSKTLLFVVIGSLIVLFIVIIAVLLADGGKAPSPTKSATTTNTSSTFDPATALDVQQASDDISNNLNQVNDSQTLPPSALDDKTLGL